MNLLALGVDHRSSPTAIREALALDGPLRDEALAALGAAHPEAEFVILSTCNRVELYAASENRPLDVARLSTWLAEFRRLDPVTLSGHLVAHHGAAVVGHLFRVASSLESLVLGEGQILGQVRDAYRAADSRGSVGPILHAVFREAIRVGRLVRAQTGMDRGRLSVASVAVDLAREVFDTFDDKTVLVIGAGKMADLSLRHLADLRPGRVLVVNRNEERSQALAACHRGEAVPFDRLFSAMIEADVVVSTTSSEQPIVAREPFARVQRARRNRLILLLDIAVPRDFDPAIGELDQVLLYNVDDLKAQVERNRAGRRKGIDPAQAIIEQETAACVAALRHRHHAGSILRELGEYADSVRSRELERLYAACPELNDQQREAIGHFARRLQNQYLHHPRAALRSASAEVPPEQHQTLLSAVRHLFGLDTGG